MKKRFTCFSSAITALTVIGLGFLVSCTPPPPATTITGSWRDPGASAYKDFFVAVLSKNQPARSALESDISSRLKKEGAKVTPSMKIFPHTEKVETLEERKAAVEKIQSLGHDAIITVSLLKKTEGARYIPGKTQYAPTNIGYGSGYNNNNIAGTVGQGYYGTFGGYYNYNYSLSSDPGYYETDKTYFIESNLYDAKTAKLVWSAQSETFNPMNIDIASSEFSGVMVAELKKANLILSKKKK